MLGKKRLPRTLFLFESVSRSSSTEEKKRHAGDQGGEVVSLLPGEKKKQDAEGTISLEEGKKRLYFLRKGKKEVFLFIRIKGVLKEKGRFSMPCRRERKMNLDHEIR